MKINCTLRKHLIEIDTQSKEKVKLLVKQLAEQNNINEELKATNQMAWVRSMNNIKNCAEEIILREFIYN